MLDLMLSRHLFPKLSIRLYLLDVVDAIYALVYLVHPYILWKMQDSIRAAAGTGAAACSSFAALDAI